MAPIMPFITETVHRNLVRGVDEAACLSVHMSEWPTPNPAARDDTLIAEIDVVQRVAGLGRAARSRSGVRVRQPLSRLLVRTPDEASAVFVARHEAQILEELNVKAVEMLAPDAELVSYRIKPNLPRIGKRFGKRVPAIRDALSTADGNAIAAAVAAGRIFDVEAGGETVAFEPEDVLVESTSAEGYACAEEGGYLVGLDTSLTEALEREGLARELVRTVQEARKQAGLDVSDRITLRIEGSSDVAAALDVHRDYVMEENARDRLGRGVLVACVLDRAHPWSRTVDDRARTGNTTVRSVQRKDHRADSPSSSIRSRGPETVGATHVSSLLGSSDVLDRNPVVRILPARPSLSVRRHSVK